MKKVEDLVHEIQEYDFLLEFKRERDPLLKIKLQALRHLQSGKKLKEVSDIVLYDVQAVRSWIRRFVEFDYEGPLEKKGRGNKPRLPKNQEEFKSKMEKFNLILDLKQLPILLDYDK